MSSDVIIPDPKDYTIEHIEIWERWQTIDGVVYYEWKRPSDKEWRRKRTAHNDNSWILRSFLTPNEYQHKYLNKDRK